ncbi:PREDICTED: zinc metalloproteinase nas-13-like [Acropora digitifera]|uniref:zinc metalloproteinase nas-13-like n=1 Tax=Acropora digitifera TaxID=70779 RepID=UPI00077AF617|nr:PREDICTED: zinc metalloproteinase nas-13-like [Acropora digitifera]
MVNETTRIVTVRSMTLIFLYFLHSNAKPTRDNDFVLIEGDMMVKRWFADDLLGVTKRGAILNRPNSKFSYYWPGDASPNGERIVRVPYSLNFGFLSRLFGNKAIEAFNKAIEQYHKQTCLRFEQKASDDTDYVEIFPGTGCWSQIGRRGGKQQLSLGVGCETRGRAIHEVMHSIGFLHEQSRLDRDEHVIILSKNIQAGKESQFKKYKQDTGNVPYDLHSVMHYSNTYFSKDETSPTILSRTDSNMQLGSSNGFSALDVVRINMLYKCPQLQTDCKCHTYLITLHNAFSYFSPTFLAQ